MNYNSEYFRTGKFSDLLMPYDRSKIQTRTVLVEKYVKRNHDSTLTSLIEILSMDNRIIGLDFTKETQDMEFMNHIVNKYFK